MVQSACDLHGYVSSVHHMTTGITASVPRLSLAENADQGLGYQS
jgi:hypothetical protein